MSLPLALTDDQRDGLVSRKVSSIIVVDTSFRPSMETYRAVSGTNPKEDWGFHFSIRDFVFVPVKKLNKHGFSNEFVKGFKETIGSEIEVMVARIRAKK